MSIGNRHAPVLQLPLATPDLCRRVVAAARTGRGPRRGQGAFTLIELMVVIGIIGILAVSSMPAIRSLTQSNTVASGSRQVLDDLAFARQSALSSRRTVYLLMVPPTIRTHLSALGAVRPDARRDALLRQFTNLVGNQYTSYALFTKRSVGDQPGRSTPKYLTEWKQLPEGMFFTAGRFIDLASAWNTETNLNVNPTNRALPYAEFPFPTADSPTLRLPYVAFDASGRLVYEEPIKSGRPPDAAVTISRGSVFPPRGNTGQFLLTAAPDVVETPRSNRTDVVVSWLTGRARVLELKLP